VLRHHLRRDDRIDYPEIIGGREIFPSRLGHR
jgi:hypothetical protein